LAAGGQKKLIDLSGFQETRYAAEQRNISRKTAEKSGQNDEYREAFPR
jgi:hypothetical protein